MSDSNMRARGGIVVGTAGHIDHGKTFLIRALTGIDTDRLAEEKKRGISIDLGFAHLDLPSGRSVSFVDVPGHERFVRNMLAGAGGIEAVLLIVSAVESVKPQTAEHFAICRLLDVQHGLIVLTKSDLASAEQIADARRAIKHLVAGSFLEVAPVLPVSAVTGEGIPQLVYALESLANEKRARDTNGFARLPIDRSFALKGFGTVVTGTLRSGVLRVGESVEVQPSGKTVRVRGLQVHGAPVEFACAGERTAVNLSGIDHGEMERGAVLLSPRTLRPSSFLHVRLNWLQPAALPEPREQFSFHAGTAEVPARVTAVVGTNFAQIRLETPVIALPGDRFILRKPSPAQTVGGGSVLDAFPPKRLARSKTVARLTALDHADLAARITILVGERRDGRSLSDLMQLTGCTNDQIRSAVTNDSNLLLAEAARRVVSKTWLLEQRRKMLELLQNFHRLHPSAPGAPLAQVRMSLDPSLAAFVLAGFSEIRLGGETAALASHRAQVSPQEAAALQNVERAFRNAGYEPPAADSVPRAPLEQLIKRGVLVRISDKLVFHGEVIAHIRKSLTSHRGRRFSVPEFKSWTQISRKYAIPLLEYLDQQRVTRRDGEHRVVL